MELYIIRHGDPDYANDTLTERGWEQANALVPRMQRIQPTDLFASPRGRAQDTARPTCEALGMQFTVEDWMNESMDYMQFCPPEKRTDDVGFTSSAASGAVLHADFAPKRTEAVRNMIACSDAFLAKLGYVREGLFYKAVQPNDRRVCCFCHGGFGSAWIAHLLGCFPLFNWYQFCFMPSSVSLFRFYTDPNGFIFPRAEYIGDCSHLQNV